MGDLKNGSNSIKYNTMQRQSSDDSVEVHAFDDIKSHLVKNEEQKTDDSLSSLSQTSFNYINAIVGSGVIGISYSFTRAGFGLGLILLILVAWITDYSLILQIRTAHLSGRQTYAGIMECAFGKIGYYVLSLVQFAYPFMAMISYNVVVGDTLSKVLIQFFPSWGSSMGMVRFFVVFLVTLFLTTPLCCYKNVARLAKVSFISLASVLLILVAITYKLISGDYDNVPYPPDSYEFAQPEILSALAIMAFAFMCHHNTFLIYQSMKDSSLEKWEKVTHVSVGFAWITSTLFGITGYATFRTLSQGDLLENYCYDDMNIARILFCITILLTFPLECFVAREIIKAQIKRFYSSDFVEYDKSIDPQGNSADDDSESTEIIITLAIVFSAFFISPTNECLGPILELNGLLAAIPLSYILPGLIFIKLDPHSLFSREKIPAILLVSFGLLVSISGTVILIQNQLFEPDLDCSTGIVLGYCKDDEVTLNSTSPTSTRLPLPKFRT